MTKHLEQSVVMDVVDILRARHSLDFYKNEVFDNKNN